MNKSIFDERAAGWDTPQRIALAEAVVASIIKHVPLSQSMAVLDFGAGTGLITLGLCGLVGEITACDTSPRMLEELRVKADSLGAVNVLSEGREPADMIASGKRFDLITSSMTLHHVADISGLFRDFHHLLNAGGMVALADLDSEAGDFHTDNTGVEHFGFSRDWIAGQCADAGFTGAAAYDACTMTKTSASGVEKRYGIFLLTGRKP